MQEPNGRNVDQPGGHPAGAPRRIRRAATGWVAHLPNLVTMTSLCCGFIGILMVMDGRFVDASLAILLCFFLDGIDGNLARLTRSTSPLGAQLDSLVDAVAFGVLPALLVFKWQLHVFGRFGALGAFALVACGVFRLARFNLQSSGHVVTSRKSSHFTGLPIPSTALALATLCLFTRSIDPGAEVMQLLPGMCLVLCLVLAALMISRVPYLSLKNPALIRAQLRAHPARWTMAVAGVAYLLGMRPWLVSFALIMAYVCSGPTAFLLTAVRDVEERSPTH